MRAVLSDIHGNLEAIEAVLADIRRLGVDQIYCLGDIVGYGPDPLACLDIAMGFDACVLGNHDQAAIFDTEGFNSNAERAILWTREQLELDGSDRARARWDFLCDLPRSICENGVQFVHGSVRNPLSDYLFPEDIHNVRKMQKTFALVQKHVFQGHTHVPGVFANGPSFVRPMDIDGVFPLGGEKAMINVGSVGQPRDGDPRASYVVVDDGKVTFHRVPYDVETTARKIHAIPELDDSLGDRLLEGR